VAKGWYAELQSGGAADGLDIAHHLPSVVRHRRRAEDRVAQAVLGKITSVRIDKCEKRPGLCEGMIILAQRDGGPVALAIRPGTWIKRGDQLVLLEGLSVGNDYPYLGHRNR
jgi:hypothetical protein